uniref:Uncharacterized protein HLSG-g11 n=1 Tax=Haemaphysalis longicornis TaxID=44386 RepID=Q4R1A3_HAELO|nr:hypothetical protein [Haemaphysalis longicornis]
MPSFYVAVLLLLNVVCPKLASGDEANRAKYDGWGSPCTYDNCTENKDCKNGCPCSSDGNGMKVCAMPDDLMDAAK